MQNLKEQNLGEDDVKIHLVCQNMFLTLSLGFYLKGHVSTLDEADFIITDSPKLRQKYTHLPICVIGDDLHIPCTVYEMFSQLHEFYSHVNAKQAEIFQKDIYAIKQNETKLQHKEAKINQHYKNKEQKSNKSEIQNNDMQENDIIEIIKQKKLQEIMQNTDPALSKQIESLFNELSQKIYNTINKNNKEKNV